MRDPLMARTWNSDRALAVMLVALAILLFVAIPLEGASFLPSQARFLTVVCYTVLGVAGVLAVTHRPATRALGFALALVPAGLTWIDAFAPGMGLGHLRAAFGIAALLILAGVALWLVLAPGSITPSRIGGSIAVYLLVALMFGELFWLLEQAQPGSIQFASMPASSDVVHADLVYFSIASLTTLGFGDIIPVSTTARVLVTLEALFGQLYLVVLVGRLVSLTISPDPPAPREHPS